MDFMDSPGSSPLCRLLLGAIRSAQGTSLGDLHASNAPSLSGLQYKQKVLKELLHLISVIGLFYIKSGVGKLGSQGPHAAH